ncbi:MAG: hemolysin III family protein [Clostridia bacterium]|nr:hemolysin III family protein [Clostridia bacterium]
MSKKEIKRKYRIAKKKLKKEYKAARAIQKRELRAQLDDVRESFECDLSEFYLLTGKKPPEDPPRRPVLEEIGNAVTHGIGAVFAIVSLVLMLRLSESPVEYLSAIVYSVGMFFMFAMSCLYHAFSHGSAVKRLFRRFDYTGVYLLIGATFTPPLLCFIGGTFGTLFSIIQWVVIIVGITLIAVFGPTRLRRVHMPLYITLGWSALLLLPSLIKGSLPLAMWILGGGVAYTLGIIPFMMKSKVSHFIWHFFVLAGALVQWIGIYNYIFLS